MSSSYHPRVITYDSDTQMYTVKVPELSIEVTSDTETSAMVEARYKVEAYYIETSRQIKKYNGDTMEYAD